MYLGGYGYLRHTHLFVHNGTFYTDHGKLKGTDSVDLGYRRFPSHSNDLLAGVYYPLRKLEGMLWRLRH